MWGLTEQLWREVSTEKLPVAQLVNKYSGVDMETSYALYFIYLQDWPVKLISIQMETALPTTLFWIWILQPTHSM
jgi:hypothetical protein